MRVSAKHVREVTATDLDGLVAAAVPEDRAIEFKMKLPLPVDPVDGEDPAKRQAREDEVRTEFLRDVSSFANADGGTIIFGIAQRSGGIASKVVGLGDVTIGDEQLRLEQTLSSGLHPALSGHEFHVIDHSNGPVLLLGIPNSFARPHMVLGPRRVGQFWGRHSTGKYLMGVHEVRRAMLETDEWERAAESYRLERLELARRQPPQLNWSGGLLFLHVLPLGRLHERVDLRGRDELLATHFENSSRNARRNLDGLQLLQIRSGSALQFIQWFRHGGVEVCWSLAPLTLGNATGTRHYVVGSVLNDALRKAMRSSISWLASLEVSPPYAASISALEVNSLSLTRTAAPIFDDLLAFAFDRPKVLIPEVVIDGPEGGRAAESELLDLLWQAAGWHENPLA